MMKTAFVTGSTGLLGNNLVRALLARGYRVKALARSREKAHRQFSGLSGVEVVEGDMRHVGGFVNDLIGCDALFHTAAFFRDSYKGGRHWDSLYETNVLGTGEVLQAAYDAGVRHAVYTSSIAVLDGAPGQAIDETMSRARDAADDYFRSKILAEQKVQQFLRAHPDMFVALVLPGWMLGPGDIGLTMPGAFLLNYLRRRMHGLLPGSFSLVDARDVAAVEIAALEKGRNGERYLAAGRHTELETLVPMMEQISGVETPSRRIPLGLLRVAARVQELYGRLAGRPILLSNAMVDLIARESDRTHFDHAKTRRELNVEFRPLEQTLSEAIAWYRRNGFVATG